MAQNTSPDVENPFPGQLNSIQLNIVTTIDVANTLSTGLIDGHAFLMDNSPDSANKGTPLLETVCKQGQVLNWLVYCLDMERRPDGTWPPFARIVNIVFLNDDGESVHGLKVCTDLKIYGGPDELRSRYTPSYYYWAGTVLPDLAPGLYRYRLVLEFDATHSGGQKQYFQVSTPALRVLPLDYKHN